MKEQETPSRCRPFRLSESEAAWALANPKEDMAKKLAASLRLNCPELPDPLLEYRFARDIVGDEAGVRDSA